LEKPIGHDAPIRKGRGFQQPSRIEKSSNKDKKKKKNQKDKTKNKEMMKHATEIGLTVLKAANTAQSPMAKTGQI
jgi:hypothetical protein